MTKVFCILLMSILLLPVLRGRLLAGGGKFEGTDLTLHMFFHLNQY